MKKADSEELDYEGDDVSLKKLFPVTFEKKDDAEEDDDDDMEEGEILDADGDFVCFFYQSGKCYDGDKCRFLHVTDKGLYRMFDSPESSKFQNASAGYPGCSMPKDTPLSAWDRAIVEAKKLIKEKESRVNSTHKPVVITIESDDEPKLSRQKPRRYRSPEDLISLSDDLSDSPRQKPRKNPRSRDSDVKWYDHWRQSPVSYSKSSKFRRRKSSSSSSSSERRIHYKERNRSQKRTSRNRRRSSRYSSSSSSPVCRSRKEKFERNFKAQEKKVASSVNKKLDERPISLNHVKKMPHNKCNISFAPDKSVKKVPCTRQEKKTPLSFDDKPLKLTELVKKIPPPINNRQPTDACKGTLNKILPAEKKKIHHPPTPVHSCSDMSISPLSDSPLTDCLNEDTKTGKNKRTLHAGQHCSFSVPKVCHLNVEKILMSPENKAVSLYHKETKLLQNDGLGATKNSTEAKSKDTPSKCATVSREVNDLPKLKVVKKLHFERLENDLLKFQPSLRSELFRPTPAKSTVPSNPKKSAEDADNRMSEKNSLPLTQKVKKNEKDLRLSTKPLSKKEVLLKQLAAINAEIERKKKQLCEEDK